MNAMETAVLWSLMQAGVVAAAGLAAAWVVGRRSAAAAATATTAAAGMILLVTALAPAPMPELAALDVPSVAVSSEARDDREGVAGGARDGAASLEVAPAFDLRRAIEWVRSSLKAVGGAKPQGMGGAWRRGMALALVGGAVVGLAQLGLAWRHVRRLRRSARPVDDAATVALFAEVCKSLGVRRTVLLCESTGVASPAVIGWRRPIVLLPIKRDGWSDNELRAALAHELAHVVRGDFAWRTTAGLAAAIHFLNPPVHWLVRRLVLVQELAADRLAASAMGAGEYLRAISTLAVRLDDSGATQPAWLRAERIVAPAFSSNLMRRIVMLRSKEGRGGKSAAGVIAAALVAVTGVGALAVRGAAESAVPQVVNTIDGTEPVATPYTAPVFHRAPVDLSMLPRVNKGLLVLRLRELSQHAAFVDAFQFANAMLHEELAAVQPGGKAPEIHLESIDFVACDLKATIKPKTGPSEDEGGKFSVACEDFVVRFVGAVDWREWLTKHVAGAEEFTEEGFDYVKLPGAPGMELVRFCVAERDPRTLVFSMNVKRLKEMARGESAAGDAKVEDVWHDLDGGLATVVLADPVVDIQAAAKGATPDWTDPASAVLQTLCLNAAAFGAAFDLDATSNLSSVQIQFACRDRAAAEKLHGAIEAARPLLIAFLEHVHVESPTGGNEDMEQTMGDETTAEQSQQWYAELVRSCQVELVEGAAGTVDVRLRALAPFPTSIIAAYARVEEGDAAEATATATAGGARRQ